jgi:hypothetical protein
VNSVVADPQFEDADRQLFQLKSTSPALALGFQQLGDLPSRVGPRAPVLVVSPV